MFRRFQDRHIGPSARERDQMLETIGVPSLDALIDEAVPQGIRLDGPLELPAGESEYAFLTYIRGIAGRNQLFRSFIGMGYYGTITPGVIVRNMLQNPGWYTPYTPYQSEVAQGRLEALLAFQTMVHDLTGTDISNASLLDEATAAAEAMTMAHRIGAHGNRNNAERKAFLASSRCFPQTLAVLKGRAEPMGFDLQIVEPDEMLLNASVFGILLQYPDDNGAVDDLAPLIDRAHEAGALVVVATDLLALTILTPPGEMNADIIVGSAQRLGVPMGYGGPHAAFLATREEHVRQMPGRLIGLSVDGDGDPAYRMAIQTREQHIRREKATSNICTAQALLANMAAMYAVYHGPEGLAGIARRIHGFAGALEDVVTRFGCAQANAAYFDTLKIRVRGGEDAVTRLREAALEVHVNLRYFGDEGPDRDGHVGVSFDETTTPDDVMSVAYVFAKALGAEVALDLLKTGEIGRSVEGRAAGRWPGAPGDADDAGKPFPPALQRQTGFLTHPVFNTYHSEAQMMRYLRNLERKDIGLDRSMIPLGSCTLKLSASTAMLPITWPAFAEMHPFAPVDQAEGYAHVIRELEDALARITSFAAVSLQPNSGAQGEFSGLMVIRAWHRDRGEGHRDLVLIPASAHGTNPASAVMAGMRVLVVASDARGDVDVADLRAKAEANRDHLAAFMITYPSTHGVYEDGIPEICRIVHDRGGQVYMDGANMNAQVGLTSPAKIGADVCHLNLHKTFAIPHGGGGPGVGPICVAAHLAPYLPGHPIVSVGGERAIPAVAAAPWGSANVLPISHAYIRMLGGPGLKAATEHAILNVNYLKARLESRYDVLYTRPNGRVAHEMILDLRHFKREAGESTVGRDIEITAEDVAKRLIDYGFHAPTVSFPVPGTLMVEPTESEPLGELDRFCEAMIQIRHEIQAVLDGGADAHDNVLKNAPHTAAQVTADEWTHPYSRAEAAFPLAWVRENKYWPPVGRVDNPYGDRNLLCICPTPI